MSMSWKELSSTTAQSEGAMRPTSGKRGLPMFPPTQTVFPAARSISARRVVVVVFPSEPVTAITGQGQT